MLLSLQCSAGNSKYGKIKEENMEINVLGDINGGEYTMIYLKIHFKMTRNAKEKVNNK